VEAIQKSLEMLHQLSLTTRLGASSYNFLSKLVQATPDLSRHAHINKRHKQEKQAAAKLSPPELCAFPAPSFAPVDFASNLTSSGVDVLPLMTGTDQNTFDLDNFLANNPFGDVSNSASLDMGGLEQIWDWDDLHLDVLPQHDSSA
jgi:hypothetical protein